MVPPWVGPVALVLLVVLSPDVAVVVGIKCLWGWTGRYLFPGACLPGVIEVYLVVAVLAVIFR